MQWNWNRGWRWVSSHGYAIICEMSPADSYCVIWSQTINILQRILTVINQRILQGDSFFNCSIIQYQHVRYNKLSLCMRATFTTVWCRSGLELKWFAFHCRDYFETDWWLLFLCLCECHVSRLFTISIHYPDGKNLGSASIRYRSDLKMSDWCLIHVCYLGNDKQTVRYSKFSVAPLYSQYYTSH